jgi:hypothetical protein
MNARRPASYLDALVVGAVGIAMAAAAASAGQDSRRDQQPPAYKPGVTIVPIDVRVLDQPDGRSPT